MTDAPRDGLRARARERLLEPDGALSAAAVGSLTVLFACGLSYYHYKHEGWWQTIVFAGAVTATLIAALTFATRRVLFSIAVISALVTVIVIVSDVKRHYIDMVLHAYDVVFYLTSPSTLSFLWVDHKLELALLAGALAATAILGRIIYRHDSSRIRRPVSAAAGIACAALALWAANARGERSHTLFYWDDLYLSSFYSSWSETMETLWRGQLLEALESQSKPPFVSPLSCSAVKPPHIILIHQESMVPPSYFPAIGYDRTLDPFFRSFDGKLHKLRVETYGGASWLTEFSVLAGVSTYSFGGMRTFVQSMMAGKIRDTLPQTLARCGYRNSLFYPVPKDFVASGRFYSAIGMAENFDFKAQGAKRYNERDSFYYGNALAHMERQLSGGSGPLFTYIITSATHLPYTVKYDPEVSIQGGATGTEPEMSEYLRRVGMARLDFDAFRAELSRRFPNERFLIVQYGDHQPIATRTLLGFDHKLEAESLVMSPESPGFLTYYAMEGINYDPPPMPDVATLDVPYLSAALLQAARLPLPQSYQERLRLMGVCEGRYFTCSKRFEIRSTKVGRPCWQWSDQR